MAHHRNRFFKSIGTALFIPAAIFLGQSLCEAANRPNVLLITTDQQTINQLSCAGKTEVKTPSIDSIAARGIRFGKSYCSFPLCSPSRASQVTGLMPHQAGIYGNKDNGGIPPNIPSLGTLFQAAGYQTAWSGKWHLPAAYPGYIPTKPGKESPKMKLKTTIPGFEVLPLEGPIYNSVATKSPGLVADVAALAAAVKFLKQPHQKPFLLSVAFLNPHDICQYTDTPEIYPKPAPGTVLPTLPANFNATDKEVMRNEGASKVSAWTDDQWRTYRWQYNRLTEIVDGHIGKLLAALKETGNADNTIVIFTSDHGEMEGSHKRVHKTSFYEEAVAVPLIIALPGATVKPAVDATHLVTNLDLLPTLCDYVGITTPANVAGRSLRPVIEGNPKKWRDYVVSEMKSIRMVRTARYKLIAFTADASRDQFFDLEKDPGETHNLIADESLKPVIAQHRQQLGEWIIATKDDLGKGDKAGGGDGE